MQPLSNPQSSMQRYGNGPRANAAKKRGGGGTATRSKSKSTAMMLLTLTLLVNVTVPKLGYHVGSVPVYALDILQILFLYFAFKTEPIKLRRKTAKPLYFLVPIIFFIVLSEFYGTLSQGSPEVSIYTLGQIIPAILMCVGVARCVRTEDDIVRLLKVFCIGLIFTGLVAMMVSFAVTRNLVTQYLLTNPLLNSRDSVTALFQSADTIRGTSLVGVSNMTGTFLNMMLPTAIVLYRYSGTSAFWRGIVIASVLIGIFAVMITYSRSAYLGFFLVALAVLFMGSFRGKSIIILSGALVSISVFAIGVDSDNFNFDRLERRMNATLYDPYADEQESERIDSYLKAGEFIAEQPSLFALGEGTNSDKRVSSLTDRPDHSVFGRALFSYGLIASLAYCALMFAALSTAYGNIRKARDPRSFLFDFSRSILAGLLATIPWFLFTHAIISNPRATSFFFIYLGLVYAVNRMATAEVERRRSNNRYRMMAQRNNDAFPHQAGPVETRG